MVRIFTPKPLLDNSKPLALDRYFLIRVGPAGGFCTNFMAKTSLVGFLLNIATATVCKPNCGYALSIPVRINSNCVDMVFLLLFVHVMDS